MMVAYRNLLLACNGVSFRTETKSKHFSISIPKENFHVYSIFGERNLTCNQENILSCKSRFVVRRLIDQSTCHDCRHFIKKRYSICHDHIITFPHLVPFDTAKIK